MAKGDFRDYSDPSKNNFTRYVQNSPVPKTTPQGLAMSSPLQPPTGLTVNPNYGKLNSLWDTAGNEFGGTGGMGSYGTYASPTGEVIGLDQNAYNAVQTPYSSDGTALDFSKANSNSGPGLGWAKTGLDAFNAYNMYQQSKLAKEQLGLAREQFGFEKAATNRSLQNQASQYNTGLQNSGEVGMALAGSTMDANAIGLRQAQLDAQKISTAAIG